MTGVGYKAAREAKALEVMVRGLRAAETTIGLLAAHNADTELDSGVKGLGEAIDAYFGHDHATTALERAKGAMAPAKAATAARMTRHIKARGTAVQHAMDSAQIGALPKPRMRAGGDERGQARIRKAVAHSDGLVDGRSRDRDQACRDIVSHIHGMARAKGHLGREHCVKVVKSILRTWQGDVQVMSAARGAGWRV